MDKKKEGKPGEARAASRRSVRDNGLEIAEQSGEILPRPASAPVISSVRVSNGHLEVPADPHLSSGLQVLASGPSDWSEALDIIAIGSTEQAVEGMKLVCHELSQAANDSERTAMDDFVKDADRLVQCLTTKVGKTFNLSLAGSSSRSCKYVLNTLMQTFQVKKLAHEVRENTLNSLITELLLWLLDERVPLMDDGSQLLKALNVLMLKILENAKRTSAFVVLISLLRPLDPSRWPSPASEDASVVRSQKFSDLVVKCLIKLTKVLQSTIFEVDLDCLLQSIHVYLQDLGMEEIRRRAGADDKPLRMVKTVLHELVKLRGTAIKGHLSMVPIDLEPQPIILAYIDLNLQTLASAKVVPGQPHWGDSATNSPSSATHSADAQLKQELAAVFKKIGDKQTCTIGLYELYRITQLYPQVDIFSQLQNASEAFRTYIRDGLSQMEKNAAAGRTPSSVPISTPPPVSPSLTSPKLAPPSPLNAKVQSARPDDTNSNVNIGHKDVDSSADGVSPVGCTDQPDPRKSSHMRPVEDQDENTNVLGGEIKSSNAAPLGTLDAIRERMKSIQAAAAAGNAESGPLISYSNGYIPAFTRNFVSQAAESLCQEALPQSGGVPPMDEKALSGLQARMERLKSGVIEPLS